MDNETKTWLYDILQSIEEVESYYGYTPEEFEKYAADIKTKRAVERNLEIIDEAVNRIFKRDKDFQLKSAEKITGIRNRIMHGHANVSDELVWSIVTNHLPMLKEEINYLLNE